MGAASASVCYSVEPPLRQRIAEVSHVVFKCVHICPRDCEFAGRMCGSGIAMRGGRVLKLPHARHQAFHVQP